MEVSGSEPQPWRARTLQGQDRRPAQYPIPWSKAPLGERLRRVAFAELLLIGGPLLCVMLAYVNNKRAERDWCRQQPGRTLADLQAARDAAKRRKHATGAKKQREEQRQQAAEAQRQEQERLRRDAEHAVERGREEVRQRQEAERIQQEQERQRRNAESAAERLSQEERQRHDAEHRSADQDYRETGSREVADGDRPGGKLFKRAEVRFITPSWSPPQPGPDESLNKRAEAAFPPTDCDGGADDNDARLSSQPIPADLQTLLDLGTEVGHLTYDQVGGWLEVILSRDGRIGPIDIFPDTPENRRNLEEVQLLLEQVGIELVPEGEASLCYIPAKPWLDADEDEDDADEDEGDSEYAAWQQNAIRAMEGD
jgi:hypothetical protein